MNTDSKYSTNKSSNTNEEGDIDQEVMNYLFSDSEEDEVYCDNYDQSNVTFDADPDEKKPYWLLRSELASWACTSGKGNTLSSLTDLCKILRPYGFSNLPSDSRSLMNTPRESGTLIRDVFPGQYIHIGLQIGISVA